ncbi:MAG TPA: von Willebrand factor type A domain-containing protein, partial [Verrucomicrobiae bacterium]|nr:von Willebrand factor type A domain-containing protein [Verrucomicrobiae bacterium]
MSADSPKSPREELETRLTALLLGELSAEEAAALRQAIGQDPELARLENQLKETIGLVRQAAASKDEKTIEPAAALQLSAERRAKLLASFKTTRLEIPRKPRRTLRLNRELLKLAAMVVALLLVGGVVVSYFTSKNMDRVNGENHGHYFGFFFGEDSFAAKSKANAGSDSTWETSYKPNPSDSPAAAAYAINGQFPANRGGAPAGSVIANELAEGSYYAGVPPALPNTPRPSAEYAGVSVAPGGGRRNTPPPPVASPTPAKDLRQLAQNAYRFRSTIALPTSSEAQTPGATPSDALGDAVAPGSFVAGVPEPLREESNSRRRSGLAGGPGGFGQGGGGFGGGGGPVAASEGKDAGRIPDAGLPTTSAMAFANQTPGKSQQFGEVADGFGIPNVGMVPATPPPLGGLADTKSSGLAGANASWDTGAKAAEAASADPNRAAGTWAGDTFNWATKEVPANKPPTTTTQPAANADWFEAKDVNGPAPTIAQNPVGRASPPALFGSGPAPAFTPNPVPSVDPATGLPVASMVAGAATAASLPTAGSVDAEGKRTVPLVVTDAPFLFASGREANEPLPSPAKQLPSPGSYEFALTTPDVGGLQILKRPTLQGQAPVAPATGLPMDAGALVSKSETTLEASRDGAALAGDKNRKIDGAVDGEAAAFRNGREVKQQVPNRPVRLAAKPAETPAPDRRPDVAKTASFPDDVDMLLERATNAIVTLTLPTIVGQNATVAPGQLSAGSVDSTFDGAPMLASTNGTLVLGTLIADPTHGTGDGREWGIRQKLDADGDSAARLSLLGDLTQPQSNKKASAEVQDKLAKVDRGGAGGVYSVNAVGYETNAVLPQTATAKPPPVVDEERKKESESIVAKRSGGSSGPVTVNVSTTEGAAKPPGQIAVGGNFTTSEDSKRASAEAVFRKSRVEIALPPGGENAQGVEREPRVQAGPVVINEIQYQPLEERKSTFASRLNQVVDRAASGAGATAGAERSNENLVTNASGSYYALKRDLDTAKDVRDQLHKRFWQENVDQAMPRSSIVQIIDKAEAQPPKNSSVWGRITGAFSGDPVATARIAVEKDASDIGGITGAQSYAGFDPYWTQTQLEKIQSKAALEKVIEKLDLKDAWAKEHGGGSKLSTEDTLRLLKKKLDVRTKPNSSLIDIRVKDDDSDEAARIANTIAEVYRDSRLETYKQMNAAGLQLLTEELSKHDKEIDRAKEELERRQKELTPEQADVSLPKLAPTAAIPQPEVNAAENFFSTFSLNVSDVSFKLAAASLEKGQMPDPATVRSEEFINAFDYRDPEPKGSAPIAFAWERARYPFAHNRDLLRFSIKTAASGRQPGRPLNLVLLLDNSGSMERADRVRVIRECIRVLTRQLQPQDRVSVVAFARTARLVVDGFSGSDAGNLPEVIGHLAPDGGTNLEEAMRVAYEAALKHFLPDGVNRVVLLTDGAANLGDVEPESLKKKVEAHRKQGVALDCFGIGWEGYNDDLLEVLSRNGDGRYGFVNTPEAAA